MESSKNSTYVQMDTCMFIFVKTFEWIVMQVLFIKYAEMVNILSCLGSYERRELRIGYYDITEKYLKWNVYKCMLYLETQSEMVKKFPALQQEW